MIVSIGQPAYLPWPGFFDRILKSNLFISLDHVQFERRGFTKRNKIKTAQGPSWLAVPVQTKGKYKDCPISQLEIENSTDWSHKHLRTIVSSYGKAPYFNQYSGYFKDVYQREWNLLNDLITETNYFLRKELKIHTEIITSTELKPVETKSNLILELCQKVGATTYLSGPLGRDYLDVDAFHQAGIEVLYHDYQCPQYPQLFGDFEPYMSVIDMLFNCGAESHDRLQNPPDCLKKA
ncbi:MAG TPA: WbqC family protein [Emcibacteraceae bacterium]|nr:WbqC family protein [Emcibacteraceae bacterium]